MNRKKVLFVYKELTTFVRDDKHILEKKYELTDLVFAPYQKKHIIAITLIKHFFYLLFNSWRFSITYIWLGDYHAFLPALFAKIYKKKSVIILGGPDAIGIESINHGVFVKNNLRAKMVKATYRLVNFIIPVDDCLVKSYDHYFEPQKSPIKVGVLHYVNGIENKIKVIRTGYNFDFWNLQKFNKKENQAISVCKINAYDRYFIKGIDILCESAKLLPEHNFFVVGVTQEMQKVFLSQKPGNVTFIDYIAQEKFLDLLKESKVYIQLSISEGLPNALCEAMLCECIPVGSSVAGIPNAIGDTGFIVDKKNTNLAVEKLKQAFIADLSLGKKARNRIMKLCDIREREKEILKLLQ